MQGSFDVLKPSGAVSIIDSIFKPDEIEFSTEIKVVEWDALKGTIFELLPDGFLIKESDADAFPDELLDCIRIADFNDMAKVG